MIFNDALLIYPPSALTRRDERCQNLINDQSVIIKLPPMDLAYISAILLKENINCTIRDYPSEGCNWGNFKEDLIKMHPDILIVKTTSPTLKDDLYSCDIAKSIMENIITIIVGSPLNFYGEKELKDFKNIDIVINDEAESVFSQFRKEINLPEISGIRFNENGKITRTRYAKFIENLDILPFPARHLIRNEIYISPDTKKAITTIETSKGCPYKCIFCVAGKLQGEKIRYRSPENVVKEIKNCFNRYKIKCFLFNADTFTFSKEWVIELCEYIINSRLNIVWACNSRVDTINLEVLKIMKEAGCHNIGFGVESGNNEILYKMKKGITKEQSKRAIELCKEVGIKVHVFFVIGLPWETQETLTETLKFAKELNPDFFDFNIALPLPGSEYYNIVRENKLFLGSLEGHSYSNSPVKSFYLSSENLIKWRKNMLLSLYLRPSYIIKIILPLINHPIILKNYLIYAVRKLVQILR